MNQLTFDDITANRHRGHENSVKAHNPSTAAKQRDEVLDLLKIYTKGLTSWEISGQLNIGYTSASARCSELKRLGLIFEDGRRETKPGSGNKAAILKVKE